jgi:hypothetical protein
MLEGDPVHSGMAMRNAPDSRPFGSRQKPRSGKDCGIRMSSRNGSADLLKNDCVSSLRADTFTSPTPGIAIARIITSV